MTLLPPEVPKCPGLTAQRAVGLLQKHEITPLNLLDAAEQRIAEIEPKLNAPEPPPWRDGSRVSGPIEGMGLPLQSRPQDLTAVAVRCIEGSRVFAGRITERSDILLEAVRGQRLPISL